MPCALRLALWGIYFFCSEKLVGNWEFCNLIFLAALSCYCNRGFRRYLSYHLIYFTVSPYLLYQYLAVCNCTASRWYYRSLDFLFCNISLYIAWHLGEESFYCSEMSLASTGSVTKLVTLTLQFRCPAPLCTALHTHILYSMYLYWNSLVCTLV